MDTCALIVDRIDDRDNSSRRGESGSASTALANVEEHKACLVCNAIILGESCVVQHLSDKGSCNVCSMCINISFGVVRVVIVHEDLPMACVVCTNVITHRVVGVMEETAVLIHTRVGEAYESVFSVWW